MMLEICAFLILNYLNCEICGNYNHSTCSGDFCCGWSAYGLKCYDDGYCNGHQCYMIQNSSSCSAFTCCTWNLALNACYDSCCNGSNSCSSPNCSADFCSSCYTPNTCNAYKECSWDYDWGGICGLSSCYDNKQCSSCNNNRDCTNIHTCKWENYQCKKYEDRSFLFIVFGIPVIGFVVIVGSIIVCVCCYRRIRKLRQHPHTVVPLTSNVSQHTSPIPPLVGYFPPQTGYTLEDGYIQDNGGYAAHTPTQTQGRYVAPPPPLQQQSGFLAGSWGGVVVEGQSGNAAAGQEGLRITQGQGEYMQQIRPGYSQQQHLPPGNNHGPLQGGWSYYPMQTQAQTHPQAQTQRQTQTQTQTAMYGRDYPSQDQRTVSASVPLPLPATVSVLSGGGSGST